MYGRLQDDEESQEGRGQPGPVQVGASGVCDRVSSGSYAMGWIKDNKLYVTSLVCDLTK